MEPVKSSKPRRLIVGVTVVASLVGAGVLGAQGRRIMIGESIHVGPGEAVEEATCVACSIHVEGTVTGDAFVVLGTLENRGALEGDATVIGGTLESSGSVLGKSAVIGGNMRLLSGVGGDAIAILGSIEAASSDASIGGDAVVVLGRQSGISPESVGGSIEHVGGERFGRLVLFGSVIGLVVSVLVIFATLLALNTLAYLILGTRRVQTIATTLSGNPLACLLSGLGTSLVLAVVAVTVAILFPVAVPILAVFLLLSVVGYTGATYRIGRNLFPNRSQVVATQSAAAVVVAIQLLPVVGWLVLLVVWSVAIGAAVLSGFGTSADWLVDRAIGRTRSHRLAG